MEEKNQKSIEERQKKLRNAILQLNIFTEIDNNSLDYNDGDIKNFLHTLCPKHINEIDEVITCQSINKERLKKIIADSIYDEFNAVLDPYCSIVAGPYHIVAQPDNIYLYGNKIIASVYHGKPNIIMRRANDACFEYVPKNDSYCFTDQKREICIQTCDDNNEEILIDYYEKEVEQKITDNNLKKSAKECLVFLKSVSLVELEM